MPDRIDQMSHDELKAATRELVRVVTIAYPHLFTDEMRPFQPQPLDKLREWLTANGWDQHNTCRIGSLEVIINGGDAINERWTHAE